MDFIKSPIGSVCAGAVVTLTKFAISWTPTKTDDYYMSKTAYEIIKSQLLPKELCGIPLTVAEQNALLVAKTNMENAYKAMIEYKESKKKKK